MRGKCRKGSDSWYDEGNVCLAVEEIEAWYQRWGQRKEVTEFVYWAERIRSEVWHAVWMMLQWCNRFSSRSIGAIIPRRHRYPPRVQPE
jgi:hypothetical protein